MTWKGTLEHDTNIERLVLKGIVPILSYVVLNVMLRLEMIINQELEIKKIY